MSNAPRRLVTDEQRERLYIAKDRGGLCALCGRVLGSDESVYIEPVAVERKSLTAPGTRWGRATTHRDAPLGEECASPEFRAWAEERPPERCEGCERPVYYSVGREARRRFSCSKRCAARASRAGRGG